MSETQDEIAAERDRLRAENDDLRRQYGQPVRPPFQLSEGDRQQLEQLGYINYAGELLLREDVLELLAGTKQAGVKIAEPKPEVVEAARKLQQGVRKRAAVFR